MTLTHETLELNRSDGQRVVIYLATPGSPDHDAMVLLDLAAQATQAEQATQTGQAGPRTSRQVPGGLPG
jgi:hypothetical protein